MAFSEDAAGDAVADTEFPCGNWMLWGAVAVFGDDDDADRNQFRKYGCLVGAGVVPDND